MKNIFLIVFFAFIVNVKAQIALEQTYSSAAFNTTISQRNQLYNLNLEVDGKKLVFVDRTNKVINLYNQNHTLWKSISFANATDLSSNSNAQTIMYISQHLFDMDDEIEFLYVDTGGPGSTVTQVVNEDGSILFTATNQGPFVFPTAPQLQVPIFNSDNGTKLILSGDGTDGNAYVYSLGGALTTEIAGNQNDVELSTRNIVVLNQNVPNPFAEQTTISYYLPDNVIRAQIIFLDQKGIIIKAVDITEKGKGQLNVFANDLSNGVYTYSLIMDGQTTETKKMVKTK